VDYTESSKITECVHHLEGFLEVMPWLCWGLAWQVGNGHNVQVGIDSFVGSKDWHSLSDTLLHILHIKGFSTLNHFRSGDSELDNDWLKEYFFSVWTLHWVKNGKNILLSLTY